MQVAAILKERAVTRGIRCEWLRHRFPQVDRHRAGFRWGLPAGQRIATKCASFSGQVIAVRRAVQKKRPSPSIRRKFPRGDKQVTLQFKLAARA
jgi:hypothetical protein